MTRHLLTALLLAAALAPAHPACAVPAALTDSLDIKIGQMIMVGFRGTEAAGDLSVLRDISERGIGGVILFDYDVELKSPVRNITSPAQVRALITALRERARIPLFVAVDQEGGKVNRLKPKYGFPATMSQEELGRLNNIDSTRAHASRMGAVLSGLGFNVDFAPDVDVNINPANPVIGKLGRSFGRDPELVARHGAAVLEGLHTHGVLGALKHFPGHGSSTADSHEGFVNVSATWSRKELVPFRALVRSGTCDMVMTAHIFHSGIDPVYPATLSAAAISLLRDTLGWKGVVVSDDMQMRAITDLYGFEQAVARAVEAGVDILLFGNNAGTYDPAIAAKAIRTVRGLVRSGAIPESRIDASFARIMSLKGRLHQD